jgi:hypothetical protein
VGFQSTKPRLCRHRASGALTAVPLRQRFMLRATGIVTCTFSIALVHASEGRNSGGNRSRLTVRISSRPSSQKTFQDGRSGAEALWHRRPRLDRL